MTEQILILAATRNFAQQINRSQVRFEGEVQARSCGLPIEMEGKARRRTAQTWLVRGKSAHQTVQIRDISRVDDIEVLRVAGRTVRDCCHATHDDKLHFSLIQKPNNF